MQSLTNWRSSVRVRLGPPVVELTNQFPNFGSGGDPALIGGPDRISEQSAVCESPSVTSRHKILRSPSGTKARC